MGIYPTHEKTNHERRPDGIEKWDELRRTPGLVEVRSVNATPWTIQERTDCFCCTCGDREFSDPHCRNHGFAGRRPCEQHSMPGQVDDEGVMPISVEAESERRAVFDL